MPLLVLLGSTIVLTLMPGWRSYLAGLAMTAGLLAWCYWPAAGAGNYGTVVYDYIVALGAPFFWLAFVLAMIGKIVWLGKTAPVQNRQASVRGLVGEPSA